MGLGGDRLERHAAVLHDAAIQRVGALRLDDADLGSAGDQPELEHLGEAFGKGPFKDHD